jgi:hypothetical protein
MQAGDLLATSPPEKKLKWAARERGQARKITRLALASKRHVPCAN